MTPTKTPILEARNLTHIYNQGPVEVHALRNVYLAALPGSVAVVRGRSGSGKTTLLNLLGGLDKPTDGTVALDGEPLHSMGEVDRSATRRTKIGFIFQSFGLLPMLSAIENVELPMRLLRADVDRRRERAGHLLDQVGLSHRGKHRPAELSGGEQQRVAIARALANRPRLLLADEPTGQLDSMTGREIVDLLAALVRSDGIAAVVATHDAALTAVADQVIELRDGQARHLPMRTHR